MRCLVPLGSLLVALACGRADGGERGAHADPAPHEQSAQRPAARAGALEPRTPGDAAPARPGASAGTVASAAAGPRADARLVRRGRSPLAGHLLALPSHFASADGSYDLLVHFHGFPDIVEQSAEAVPLDAALAIVNAGTGMGSYRARFEAPRSFAALADKTAPVLAERGLAGATLRRVALVAWSAGYGAVASILRRPEERARVDAVVLLDALQALRSPRDGTIEVADLAPLAEFAREAERGDKLLVVTYSEVSTPGSLASTSDSVEVFLRELGLEAEPAHGSWPMTPLPFAAETASHLSLMPLRLRSLAERGALTVRGFWGAEPEHHIAHLVQMASIALPELARRWSIAPRGSR